jgi:parallel beta-helix repeat protein
MRSKFSSMWRVVIALVLVFSLASLAAPATPAIAAGATTHNVAPPTLTYSSGNATAEWSTAQAHSGSSSVHLQTTGTLYSGHEARIRITMPSGTKLGDVTSIAWWEYLVTGYPPHVDVKIDKNGDGTEDDALVFEYAYNTETHAIAGQPTYGALNNAWYQTFSDDGEGPTAITNTANGWLSSGPPGPLGDSSFIYGTLTNWKAGTVSASVNSTTPVIALEIEIDNWIAQTNAYVDGVAMTIGGNKYYVSIQDAIDAATSGDTITVAAGTYTENVNVAKSLTLQGASSATVTVSAANPAISVFTVTASSVNMSGFTVSGATGGGQAGIYLGPGVALCNISSNNLTGSFDGIWLGAGSHNNTFTSNTLSSNYQGFEIYISSNNTFTNNIANSNTKYGFKIDSGNNNRFTNNTANSNGDKGFYSVAGDGGGSTNSTFTNNTANLNTRHGIHLIGSNVGATLTGNTFNANLVTGIKLQDTVTNLRIQNNNITNNPTGIGIDASVAGFTTWAVTHNNIVGNTLGISNAGTGILNAKNNWWGNTSGPIPETLPKEGYNSYGDKVSNNVDYEPWLLAAVVSGVTPTTYDKTLALKDGWTLVSTDKEVTIGTDWAGTANLTADSTVKIMAYKYTAGGGYDPVDSIQLTSVDAYYVKTNNGGGVGIKYSTSAPGVVTKTLGEGWNIISCAGELAGFLPLDNAGRADAYTLLSQLRYVQIGQQVGPGVTSLVGQGGYNQFTIDISKTLVMDVEWTTLKGPTRIELSPFDGYWVYMNAPKIFGVIPK